MVIAVWDGLSTSVDETIYILAFGSFGLQGIFSNIRSRPVRVLNVRFRPLLFRRRKRSALRGKDECLWTLAAISCAKKTDPA